MGRLSTLAVLWLILMLMLMLGGQGCLLPSFELAAGDAGPADGNGNGDVPACGASAELPDACAACVAEHCCDEAEACGTGTACAADLATPIEPGAVFTEAFEPLLGCMQDRCDDACQVNWGCVDNHSLPMPEGQLQLPVVAKDFISEPRMPLPDTEIRACRSIDPACELGEIDSARSDAEGGVVLDVPDGFDGYFHLSHPDYLPTLAYWNRPFSDEASWNQYMLTPSVLGGLAALVGVLGSGESLDPERGHLVFRVHTCLPAKYLDVIDPRTEAEDIEISVAPAEDASQVFYTDVNGSPSTTLTATSSDAIGGVLNLPPRNVTVTAKLAGTDTVVSRASVTIRAGHLTFVYLSPTPKL